MLNCDLFSVQGLVQWLFGSDDAVFAGVSFACITLCLTLDLGLKSDLDLIPKVTTQFLGRGVIKLGSGVESGCGDRAPLSL